MFDGGTMILRSRILSPIALLSMLACFIAAAAQAQELAGSPKATCASAPEVKGKSRQRFDSTPLMIVADELESQGQSDFHLKYASPTAECVVETFSVAGVTVTASYNPWEKGPSTLNYRFTVDRPGGKTEILVLYSGTAALASGGFMFHVSEE
jgi:hypothetical protein